jgi:predicted transcriptional regulator
MKYRSSTEISARILEVIGESNGGARTTKIMYGAYLSYMQLKDYLPRLVGAGLIVYKEDEKIYTLTPKGIVALETAKTLNELLPNDSSMASVKPKFNY